MSGKAHPQAIAAVVANTTTHTGRWKMDGRVGSSIDAVARVLFIIGVIINGGQRYSFLLDKLQLGK
jgi:hypothetical protein